MAHRWKVLLLVLAPAGLLGWSLGACTEASDIQTSGGDTGDAGSIDSVFVIAETFMTPYDEAEDVDSPAIWHGSSGEHWLLATAKAGDKIWIYDAADGSVLQPFGSEGTDDGQFNRPNGIAVVEDLMLVVERDNARMQIVRLPGLETVGYVGETTLVRPYGIAAFASANGVIETYVTDNYETADEQIPPDSELDTRVHHYRIQITQDGLESDLVKTFGETSGDGVLRKVESIVADVANEVLMISDESAGVSRYLIYGFDGTFSGRSLGAGHFPHEAEGIVLYECADGSGYWIGTDQDEGINTFVIFDRATHEYLGSFTGETTRNTDGVALTQSSFGPFESGAFFAVHNDGGVGAISWSEIAAAIGIRSDCVMPA